MKTLFAALFALALMAASVSTATACNPKTDPSCNRDVPTAGPIACDPKNDPGCNRGVPSGPNACNPKVDPTCN